jgi:hypothetical protein
VEAARPTDFRTLVALVTALQRLERFAQEDGQRHLSPKEVLLLQARITAVRERIPSDVLNSYETVKESHPKAFHDAQLFPLMVLLAVIAVWAGQKPRSSDLHVYASRMSFRVRRVNRPSLRRYARCALGRKKRNP